MLLPACGSGDSRRQDAIANLLSVLRHKGVAAHLGRLEFEARPELQSMSLEELAADILSAINLDMNTLTREDIDTISQRLPKKSQAGF